MNTRELSPRAVYAMQNAGMTVNGLTKELKKQAMALMEQGAFFPIRNCGFMTINELRRWSGVSELSRSEYYRMNRERMHEYWQRKFTKS